MVGQYLHFHHIVWIVCWYLKERTKHAKYHPPKVVIIDSERLGVWTMVHICIMHIISQYESELYYCKIKLLRLIFMKKPSNATYQLLEQKLCWNGSLWRSRKKEVKEVTFADSAGYLALTLLIRPTKFSQIKDVQKLLLIICRIPEYFYRTLKMTHSLTKWLLFSTLDWCDPGVWRCQLKTCWNCCCYWCWCWCWETCWRHFGSDLEATVWSWG